MGYRHKIGILDKKVHEKIKDLTVAQLKKLYGKSCVPCYEITNEVYEIGKYWDYEFLKPFSSKVFTRSATNKYYESDNQFFIISKEGFEAIIDSYRVKVLEYYQSILNPSETDKILGGVETPRQVIEEKIRAWGENCTKYRIFPYNLEGEEISTSWTREYSIFELVRIYKSVNWDKQYVTITAW